MFFLGIALGFFAGVAMVFIVVWMVLGPGICGWFGCFVGLSFWVFGALRCSVVLLVVCFWVGGRVS